MNAFWCIGPLAIDARVVRSHVAAVVCASPLIPLPRECLLLLLQLLLPLELQLQLLLGNCILAVNFILSGFLFRLFLSADAILLILLALAGRSGLSVKLLLPCSLGLFSTPPLLGLYRGCPGHNVLGDL